MSGDPTVGHEAPPRGEPELIVITRSDAQVRVEDSDRVASLTGAPVSELQDVLRSAGASMEPLFGSEVGEAEALLPEAEVPEGGFGTLVQVHAPAERLASLAEELRGLETVDAAYVKPPAEPAQVTVERTRALMDVEPVLQEAPSTTPNFQARQVWGSRRSVSTPPTPGRFQAARVRTSGSSTASGDGSSRTRTCSSTRSA